MICNVRNTFNAVGDHANHGRRESPLLIADSSGGSFEWLWPHNAGGERRPTSTEVRMSTEPALWAVRSTALILIEAPSPAYPGGMLVVGKSLSKEEETSCDSTPPSTHFTAASTYTPEPCTSASSTRAARFSCTAT